MSLRDYSNEFAGKKVLVTGGSRGIGAATAQRLLDGGATVAVTARNPHDETPKAATFVSGDIRTLEGAQKVAKEAIAALEGLDILVNSAGAARVHLPASTAISDEEWVDSLNINFLSALRVTYAALDELKKSKGSIVNVTSGGRIAFAGAMAHYGAAKAALNNWSEALAKELAPQGVRLNIVSPGPIITPGGDEVRKTITSAMGITDEQFFSSVPLEGRAGNPIKNHVASTHRPLIFRDPPAHDTLRSFVMKEFTIHRVEGLHGRVASLVDELIDGCRGRDEICLVEDLSYPLPVAVICDLLGVPEKDESQFQKWATQLATALEPDARHDESSRHATVAAFDEISTYMRRLIREKRRRPADDMLSGLARPETGPAMGDVDLISTAILLLVAGHETTVNLITNGMLTLLRHPKELDRLKADPERAPRLIEELLRYEPPVHFRTRKALGDIEIEGTSIPKGAPVVLLFAAGSRDPARFTDPDRFDPDREDIQHFGFGGGLHYCVGAPLARIEVEIALVSLCRRLVNPSLLDDPPPYRTGASLRGPKNLGIRIGGITQ